MENNSWESGKNVRRTNRTAGWFATKWPLLQICESESTESYITITNISHYIQNWDLKTAVLQTSNTDWRNQADCLKAGTEEWGTIMPVIWSWQMSHDWSANWCCAHNLHLHISNCFKVASVSGLVGTCSRLVANFHHSTVATAALKRTQADQNLPTHTLMASLSDRQTTKLTDARTFRNRCVLCNKNKPDLRRGRHWQGERERSRPKTRKSMPPRNSSLNTRRNDPAFSSQRYTLYLCSFTLWFT